MTREEAIELLYDIQTDAVYNVLSSEKEALDMAIKALEQQPCDDCINRAEAIKETKKLLRGNYDSEYIVETLKMLPPVTPKALEQQPAEDAISRESVIEWLKDKDIIKTKNQEENARRELAELPSVTPTRPTAQWERFKDDYNNCSKCGGLVKFYHKYKYCPECGAKMQEVEE